MDRKPNLFISFSSFQLVSELLKNEQKIKSEEVESLSSKELFPRFVDAFLKQLEAAKGEANMYVLFSKIQNKTLLITD